tara:strand:- start:4537 stop:5679 length:1143 start_codon:yes stop_codon:yes gene_type:complete
MKTTMNKLGQVIIEETIATLNESELGRRLAGEEGPDPKMVQNLAMDILQKITRDKGMRAQAAAQMGLLIKQLSKEEGDRFIDNVQAQTRFLQKEGTIEQDLKDPAKRKNMIETYGLPEDATDADIALAIRLASASLEETTNNTNKETRKPMKINMNELKQIVKEELEVILSDDEAKEFFGEEALQGLLNDAPVNEGAKPDFLDLDKDGDKEEPMKDAAEDAKEVEEEKQIFAPNHYCVHHGGVMHEGEWKLAEAVGHNYNEELEAVTHYDMQLADGTVMENVAFEDIQVTEASLAKEHMHAVRDDDEDEMKVKAKTIKVPDLNAPPKVKVMRKSAKPRHRAMAAMGGARARFEEGKARMTKADLTEMIREEMSRVFASND